MKGIVLAGGTGSRLWPNTKVVSKQLLPIYDKPLIYYPISTLMLAGVKEILIITTPEDTISFQNLLGNGSRFGIEFKYEIQPIPAGLAQALIISEDFVGGESCMMILGDNIFHGVGLGKELSKYSAIDGAHIFTYEVADPSLYGVLTLNKFDEPVSIEEKPKYSESHLAITGLYIFDKNAISAAKSVKPSDRGELEITDVLKDYLLKNRLTFTKLSRGTAWLDTGTLSSMNDASNYIRVVEERTGLKIACLEEIAFENGWVSSAWIKEILNSYGNNNYAQYLHKIIQNHA